jgi:polyhydroxybutyrate depolymerase
MVHAIAQSTGIDTRRIYATGISNGGALAYRLACDTDIFAAIGPDSATLLGDCPSPAQTSIIHIHGLADQTFPFTGGAGKRNQSAGSGSINTAGPAIPDVIASWEATNNCSYPAVTKNGLVTTSLAACQAGKAVELITIDGAGHQWPGGKPNSFAQNNILTLDPPSTALDATATIWQFFSMHPK